MQQTIGIDVSKNTLDAYRLSDRQRIQVTNDRAGQAALIRWMGKGDIPLIIFEATGAYHRLPEATLIVSEVRFIKVSPRQARRFGEATGRLAKTDRIDAAMLAKMGAVLQLKAREPRSETLQCLRKLITARRALMKDRAAAKTRLQTTIQPLLKCQLLRRLKQIQTQVQQIEAAIAGRIAEDGALSGKLDILVSIPGIAETTAWVMLIEVPELGALDGKQAASLARLAPISRQSGKWRGREAIQGGRAYLRRAIYMLALVAVRFNPDLRRKYDQLIAAGKPAKLAHRNHAEANRYGERPPTRRPPLVANPALTTTDTQHHPAEVPRLPHSRRGIRNQPRCRI